MAKQRFLRVFAWLILVGAAGCAPVISSNLRDQAAPGITFEQVFKDPTRYRGKTVIWGGVIVRSENKREGTLLEVLQKPTDYAGRPLETDRSGGRFLALYKGFLDVALYAEGREVTIAGRIEGRRTLPLGEIRYAYPLIRILEAHLWQERKDWEDLHYPYWYYPHVYPWRSFHPYW